MNLLGKGNDPLFWSEEVRNKECYKEYRDFQLKNWESLCENNNIDALKYTEFRLYGLTGDRTVFQKPYYERRVQVETAVILALIYPEEQKYLDYAMDMIFAICNEYCWSIPAHQPRLLEVVNKTHLDLFACETAYMLAEVYTLLGDRLEPLIRERIKAEVEKRVINSFLRNNTWGWEIKNTANWAAVCGGSVGCTFMLLFPEKFYDIKPRLDFTMENFLSGYKDDGFCAEGTHYWHYGFGFFCAYADMLKTFSGGKYDYFERPKVHAIATFVQKMYLSGIRCVSFSDGGETLEYHIGLLHYLKKKYDDVVVYSPKYSYINDFCGRFTWLVRAATWLDEDIYNNPAADNASAEYYGKDTEWFVKKTEKYGFAAKAGNNNEPHNHNDVGAFIIAKDTKQIVTDPGPGIYSKQYFAADTRYGIIECSSLGHSVPYFGDCVQKFGADYTSCNVEFDGGVFSMDIAGAYGSEDVKSVIRKFTCDDEKILLNDKFVYTGSSHITDRIVLREEPIVDGNTVKCENLRITFDPNEATVSIPETVISKGRTLYFADFVLNDGISEITLKFN
jgi:hypothetical protein